jgi:MOSC domain-containing protein YiiM
LTARIVSVSRCQSHRLSKPVAAEVRLVAGVGVEGDCHAGATVQHRSRLARGPAPANLRQAHLFPEELLETLRGRGFRVGPGVVGENITTRGIDLLALPRGARLVLGADAEVELTGLRTPCSQLDDYQAGLLEAMIDRPRGAAAILRAGVMAVVTGSGVVRAGDPITVVLPPGPHRPLGPV